jgi:glycosyltransferase involved in cell wall biosynthesis
VSTAHVLSANGAEAQPSEARRVLHCVPNMLNGGAQRQLVLLAAEQVRAGIDVHVAIVHSGPNAPELEATGARLHWIATGFNHDPRLLTRLVRVMREVRPDVVQSWLTQMDVLAGAAARTTGTPWVLCERSTAEFYPPSVKNLARVFLARGADAVVANSQGGAEYWRRRLPEGVPSLVVGNGLGFARILAAEPITDAAIDLPPGAKMVLHVGRFSPEKSIPVLLQGLAEAGREVPLVAYFCGDGTHEAEIRRLVGQVEARERIRVLGYRKDVFSLMKRADVLVSLSVFEGHPNAVLEAAACGCPLLLSDIPAHRAIVGDDGAFFVAGGSAPGVARGLLCCLRSAEDARRRASVARRAVDDLSPSAMASRYAQVYAGVLRRRGARQAA